MATTLSLPREAINDLNEFRSIPLESLEAAYTHLSTADGSRTLNAMHRELQPILTDRTASFLRLMVSLQALITRQPPRTPDKVVDDINATLSEPHIDVEGQRDRNRGSKSWTQAELAEWQNRLPHLRKLLALQSLRIAAKALDLSAEQTNVFHGARILTDLRPVFSEEDARGPVPSAFVLLHTMRLRFWREGHHRELSVAIDASELRLLRDACDRALKKATALSEMMTNRNLSVIEPSEDS